MSVANGSKSLDDLTANNSRIGLDDSPSTLSDVDPGRVRICDIRFDDTDEAHNRRNTDTKVLRLEGSMVLER